MIGRRIVGFVVFQRVDVNEQFLFTVEKHQAGSGTHQWVGRHQLRMRKAFINIFVDDIGFIEDEFPFNQNGDLSIWIHGRYFFWLVEEVDIPDLKIHSLFEEDKPATLRERTSCS